MFWCLQFSMMSLMLPQKGLGILWQVMGWCFLSKRILCLLICGKLSGSQKIDIRKCTHLSKGVWRKSTAFGFMVKILVLVNSQADNPSSCFILLQEESSFGSLCEGSADRGCRALWPAVGRWMASERAGQERYKNSTLYSTVQPQSSQPHDRALPAEITV